MNTTKNWILLSNCSLSENDFEFLRLLQVNIEVTQEVKEKFEIMNLVVEYVIKKSEIHLTTTCEKQETMLKLRWANDLYLLSSTEFEWG